MPLIKCHLSFGKIVAYIIVQPKWVYLCHDIVFRSSKMFEWLGTDAMFNKIDKFYVSDPWLV